MGSEATSRDGVLSPIEFNFDNWTRISLPSPPAQSGSHDGEVPGLRRFESLHSITSDANKGLTESLREIASCSNPDCTCYEESPFDSSPIVY